MTTRKGAEREAAGGTRQVRKAGGRPGRRPAGAPKACPACGKPVEDKGKICPACGANLDPGAIRQA